MLSPVHTDIVAMPSLHEYQDFAHPSSSMKMLYFEMLYFVIMEIFIRILLEVLRCVKQRPDNNIRTAIDVCQGALTEKMIVF